MIRDDARCLRRHSALGERAPDRKHAVIVMLAIRDLPTQPATPAQAAVSVTAFVRFSGSSFLRVNPLPSSPPDRVLAEAIGPSDLRYNYWSCPEYLLSRS